MMFNESHLFSPYTYDVVLSIAGSDSSGGAGIQADLKTFSALGCYGACAITALTAQNTCGVQAILPVDPYHVKQQILAVTSDIQIDAIKIGMLGSDKVVEAVAKALEHVAPCPIVIDPVLVSGTGNRLSSKSVVAAIEDLLLPQSTLITPNLYEASALVGWKVLSRGDMAKAAHQLIDKGYRNVLIKGGHLVNNKGSDLLAIKTTGPIATSWHIKPPIETTNTHGTGCSLSSAIAAFLAKGHSLPNAVANAKSYITEAIRIGAHYQLGNGEGPIHHFHHLWERTFA